MSDKLKALREQRGKLLFDARAIVDKADAEKRGMNAEENGKFKEMFDKAEELRSQIDSEEKLADAERSAAEQALRTKDESKKGADVPVSGKRSSPEYVAAFMKAIVNGQRSLNDAELRALQADSDSAGGFLVTPQQFVDQLIKDVDNMTFIRQRATKFRVPTAASMGAPTLANDPADSDWTAEILTGSEDSTMSFGKRELHPHPLAKRLKVSNKLLRMVAGADSLVRTRLAYKFGISQEKAFLTGSGSNQPLGVFTASANGVPTSRDVSTGNTTTGITFDGLISAKFSLKGEYWAKADWLFHRDVLATVAKLKDGNGQYLWRESVRAGEPDTILGRPVMMSEYAPSTLTTGLYAGMLADFSHYWIADALDMQMQVLKELYAETDQTGYIGRLETDGMPVLAEAFARVKLA
jgi:HK97 family phage major capsid protein